MNEEFMNIVIAGHVDHGKSTIIGRLLADTNSLPKGKLQEVKDRCERNSKPFEYAFLIDALKDEQSQGITIDSARVFFKTKKRHYIIIDAPGHIEFLKNMVTGASRAEAALLVIDANEGVQENSRRHGYMLSMLGIKQIAVVVNKMDLVGYKKNVFNKIVKEYTHFLSQIGVKAVSFIPVSGREGDMIANKTDNLDWHKGETVLEILDSFKKESEDMDKPFRMPVQDIYKFTKFNDDRRIISGTIDSGSVSEGDEIVFYPSGKRSNIEAIERFNDNGKSKNVTGRAIGFTLSEQIYVKRGEIAVHADELHPEVTSRMTVSLFWMGKEPMIIGKEYMLKLGTEKVLVKLEDIKKLINASDLSSDKNKREIRRHEVAECVLKLNRAIAFDVVDNISSTSRFVIVDKYNICGGGIIRKALEDKQTWVRDHVLIRNYKWIKSNIQRKQRAERYNQKSAMILITGQKNRPRKEIGRCLEEKLFTEGKLVYFLAIGSLIYGVDADIKNDRSTHEEHLRRLAEVSNILIDAGIILIVSAIELRQNDLDIIKTTIDPDMLMSVWVGDKESTDIMYDIKISDNEPMDDATNNIKRVLQEKGFMFKAW